MLTSSPVRSNMATGWSLIQREITELSRRWSLLGCSGTWLRFDNLTGVDDFRFKLKISIQNYGVCAVTETLKRFNELPFWSMLLLIANETYEMKESWAANQRRTEFCRASVSPSQPCWPMNKTSVDGIMWQDAIRALRSDNMHAS